jgi:hypothetical protein
LSTALRISRTCRLAQCDGVIPQASKQATGKAMTRGKTRSMAQLQNASLNFLSRNINRDIFVVNANAAIFVEFPQLP